MGIHETGLKPSLRHMRRAVYIPDQAGAKHDNRRSESNCLVLLATYSESSNLPRDHFMKPVYSNPSFLIYTIQQYTTIGRLEEKWETNFTTSNFWNEIAKEAETCPIPWVFERKLLIRIPNPKPVLESNLSTDVEEKSGRSTTPPHINNSKVAREV